MSKLPRKVAAIGECMLELSPKGGDDFHLGYAGDTLNATVYFCRSRATQHVNIDYFTVLGDDRFSDKMIANFQQEGIGTSQILRLSGQLPGLYLIENDELGERSFYFYRSTAAARRLFDKSNAAQLTQQLLHYDVIYFSGITVAILPIDAQKRFLHCLKLARDKNITICFDNNYRPKLWQDALQAKKIFNDILEYVNIGLPSFDDAKLLYGDRDPQMTAMRWHEAGVKEVVVKRGKYGYLLSTHDYQQWVDVAPVQRVVDTTAAGDSFNGAYLSARLAGKSMREAGVCGAKMAETVIGYAGAIIPKSKGL